tara:strand:- start:428 stop:1027 length:600 start_codon:yes stop_codon:yes gene_type:complete
MFSGIVESVQKIESVSNFSDSKSIQISRPLSFDDISLGDSISVNGVCLTVSSLIDNSFVVDIINETLNITTLDNLEIGNFVNLERAIKYNNRIGGHLLQGHVDSTALIQNIKKGKESIDMTLNMSKELISFCIYKGSIGINGVSLTISAIDNDGITVSLIPHTLENTNLSSLKVGDSVNIETDMISKYIKNHLQGIDRE